MAFVPANRQILIRGGIALGVIGALFGGAFLGMNLLGGEEKPREPPADRQIKGFGTLTHPSSGFRISYPRSWLQFDPADPPREVPLVAGPDGSNDFVLVRLCRLPEDIPPDAVPALRQGFDAIIQKGGTNILEQRQITLNRLPGFHYLYTFLDEKTQQQGVHSHYFLVDKATIIQLVFQALPVDDFKALSGTFDKVANSFRVLPRTGSVAPCAEQQPGTPGPEQPAEGAPPVPPPA